MKMFSLRRDAFDEIARPLEPHVFVFVLFAVPAVVMTTDYCQDRTESMPQEDKFCQVPCELVLGMRSAATGLVYYWQREHRLQLCDVGALCTRLQRRAMCFCRWHYSSKYRHVNFADELETTLIEG
eukprot:m.205328 g.205328  ORF g.205328 m.205328 type:complete len:126 (+) comp18872_c0_seq2:1654-2031(+)